MRVAALLFVTLAVAHAQIGIPPGISLPRRGKQSKTKQSEKILPSFAGSLKRLDAKFVVIELDDFRHLEFRRTGKTRFVHKGQEVKDTEFKPGDHVSVEASEEAGGYLTAVNVYLEAPGAPAGERAAQTHPESTAPPAAVPAKAPEAAAPQVAERATTVAPPPLPRDPDDPGPPVLRRGKPAAANTPAPEAPAPSTAAEPAVAQQPTPTPPPAAAASPSQAAVERLDERGDAVPRHPRSAEDPVIRKAQEAALEFTETLPNYVCQEIVARSQSDTQPANWRPIDVVTADLVYEDGKESYRNLAIGGKKVTKSIEETGSWSTGEFGTILIDLFSPATNASFRFRKTARIGGADTRIYDFSVQRENSHWTVKAGSQSYVPAYTGSVWIDPRSGRVRRIEMQARHLPGEFPLDKVETAVDYENVRLATVRTYLLPVHAETLSCQRGSPVCSRNVIDFRNYRRFTGESSIQFEK